VSAATATTDDGQPVGIGIVGLGAAGRAFVPAILAHPHVRLAAVADRVPELRQEIARQHGVAAHACIEDLLADASVDVIYIATPTDLHPEHAASAFAARKHVLVEKPMAVSLDAAQAMVAGAREAGVVLVVGHSHSHDLPIQRMRELIAGGSLGGVRMVNTWCYTDWMYRPRRAEELDVAQGGGVTFRQGSHQFDIIRLLCGGMARSVRASTFDWDPQRRSIGAHVAFLTFESGAAATAVYNGYGHFSTMDLGFDVSEWGFVQPRDTRAWHRPSSDRSPDAELRAKQERARHAIPARAPHQPFFGVTIVSCEKGDIRQSPDGLLVYTHDGVSEIPLSSERSPRELVLDELHAAVAGQAPAVHDGKWGLANLEVCAAAIESSASGREVQLHHQVALPG
jgi:phthalate 4,5-cis-dihydrodiol dehydrogenase